MVRAGVTAGALVLALALGAAAANEAAAGPCGGYLNVAAPADGKIPPNAAILLMGYSYGGVKVKVLLAGKEIPTTLEEWPSSTGRCGSSYFLVRPAKGDWPAGSALDVDAGGYGKLKATVGTVRDTVAPRAVVGPARGGGLLSSERYLPFKSVSDDRGPFVRVTFALMSTASAGDRTMTLDGAGEFAFSKSDACVSLVLTDLAGNTTRFGPEVCK